MAPIWFWNNRTDKGLGLWGKQKSHRRFGRGGSWLLAGIILGGLACSQVLSQSASEESKPATTSPAKDTANSASGGVSIDGSVAIYINLPKSQYVTVVIDDSTGKRVRNLISQTKLPAGRNRLIWDCYDDGVEKNGILVRKLVPPGSYKVRGLTHDGIKMIFEFPVYSGGNPPWATKEENGAWLADHSSPLGATFIPSGSPYGGGKPQILLTALVAETGRPTVWVGTDGTTYMRHAMWGWMGGEAAATDFGKNKDPRFYAYVLCSGGEKDNVVLRGLTVQGEQGPDVAVYKPKIPMPREPRDIGLTVSVRDGLAAVTVPLDNAVVFMDVKNNKVLGTAEIKAPKGVYLESGNHLLVSTEGMVKRYTMTRPSPNVAPMLDDGTPVITGLEDPRNIQKDLAENNIYVADWGNSHQIKVYSNEGQQIRVLGKPGGFQIGTYDELRMHQPQGMAIDNVGQLWVSENDWLPKRISVWDTATGKFKYARYGPPHYGGGGTIDSTDKTRLFYGEYGGTLEFKLDWEKGTSKLVAVPVRTWAVPKKFDPMPGDGFGAFGPEFPTHVGKFLYLGLGFQGSLRTNDNFAYWLYNDKDHTARPIFQLGSTRHWDFIRLSSVNAKLQELGGSFEPFICWTDMNSDGKATVDEFQVRKSKESYKLNGKPTPLHGFRMFYPGPNLEMYGSWSVKVPAPKIREDGTPLFDINKMTFQLPFTDEHHWAEDGYEGYQLSNGLWLEGFSAYKNGKMVWRYPANWDIFTPPQYPGNVVEPTRLMGPPFTPGKGEAKDVICYNGERGNMYLLTGDGLFIQTIGGHRAVDELMHFPKAIRGMDVSGYSFEDEHFHPTITRTPDGNVYMVAGKEHSSIFRLDGFDTVKLQNFGTIQVTSNGVGKLPSTLTISGRKMGKLELTVPLKSDPPTVDGKFESDWKDAKWVDIGTAGKGALQIVGNKLYAAWKTTNPNVLANNASDPEFAFKRGGAVDLMVGLAGNRADTNPLPGDMRLLICNVKGKNLAVLYRQTAMGKSLGKPVLYESPIGKVQFADVAIVTDQVEVAQVGGNVEIAVPLNLLGINPRNGEQKIGDLGILRGDGVQTVQRSYWNNQDSAMVSDIPTEARLTPNHWGTWYIGSAPEKK